MEPLTDKQDSIFQWLRYRINAGELPPTLAEIAEAFGFSSINSARQYLQTLEKKGYIEVRPQETRGIRLRAEFLENPPPRIFFLPLIGRVAAGEPIFSEQNIKTYHQINPALFSPPADYLLQVEGMSMRDANIFDGDWLAVKQSPDAISGQIVVARVNDEVTVKRFYRDSNGLIRLEPQNPDYTPIEVDEHTDFTIEGVYVGLLRHEQLLQR